MFARLGIRRATWFFASNIADEQYNHDSSGVATLFARSGLTASIKSAFAPKYSLIAFEQLVREVGHLQHRAVLREDSQVWAYAFGPHNATAPSVIIAWAPIDA